MRVKTMLLGTEEVVEIDDDQIYAFDPGLGGFEALRRYGLVPEPDSPVEWLISLDDPDVSFAVIEPFVLRADYTFELTDRDAQELGLTEPSDAMVRCIVTLNEDPAQITANLLAPLVLSRRTHMARQVILQESEYAIRTPLFSPASEAQQDGEPPARMAASA